MALKIKTMTDGDYEEIGRRYGSEEVAKEISLALERWQRDAVMLAPYGYGSKRLELFKALVASHAQAMKDRPEGLGVKRTTVQSRNGAVSGGWEWVDRAVSILTPMARADAAVANGLHEAVPGDDTALAAGIGALAKLLEAHAAEAEPETDVPGLLGEAGDLVASIAAVPGEVKGSKDATREDTRQVNILDGKVAVEIGDLNRAGKKAFRKLRDHVRQSDYKFHVLQQNGPKSAGPSPVPPAAPTPPAN